MDLNVIKAHFVAKATGDVSEQEEEDNRSIISDDELWNSNKEVSGAKIPSGDDQEIPVLNPGGNDISNLTHSPRNWYHSSMYFKIGGRSYQIQKDRINCLLAEIKADPKTFHSEHLIKQGALSSLMLKNIDKKKIISKTDNKTAFFKSFGGTED